MARVLAVGKGAPDRGGIAAFLTQLAAADFGGRHEVRLLNLTREGDRAGGRLSGANITRTLSDARAVWRAAPDVDIVHIHSALVPSVTLMRAGALAAAARGRGRAVIVHAHSGRIARWLTTPARRHAARIALAPATTIVAVSSGVRDALAAAGLRQTILVDNGVDVAAFPAGANVHTPPVVLFAAGLTPRKGALDLFAASRLLLERGVEHELVLAGGTPDEGAAAEAEVRNDAPPHARLLGPQPHAAMAALYRAADVFCLPSWWEAMPLSVLEAAASGLPVVASDVGDIGRAVVDGTTGAVVPPRSPAALADALEPYLRDPDRRRTHGAAGAAHVRQHFSIAATWRTLADLYDEIMGTTTRTHPVGVTEPRDQA